MRVVYCKMISECKCILYKDCKHVNMYMYLVVMNDEDIPLLFFKSNVYIDKEIRQIKLTFAFHKTLIYNWAVVDVEPITRFKVLFHAVPSEKRHHR